MSVRSFSEEYYKWPKSHSFFSHYCFRKIFIIFNGIGDSIVRSSAAESQKFVEQVKKKQFSIQPSFLSQSRLLSIKIETSYTLKRNLLVVCRHHYQCNWVDALRITRIAHWTDHLIWKRTISFRTEVNENWIENCAERTGRNVMGIFGWNAAHRMIFNEWQKRVKQNWALMQSGFVTLVFLVQNCLMSKCQFTITEIFLKRWAAADSWDANG